MVVQPQSRLLFLRHDRLNLDQRGVIRLPAPRSLGRVSVIQPIFSEQPAQTRIDAAGCL
jgi:hypothetical protein